MKRAIAAALLLAAPLPLLAQPAPAPAAVKVPDQVTRLRDAALTDQIAWDIAEGLTTEVGQRLAGTEAEARARVWAAAKLRSLGFSNVRVETFPITNWTRGPESAAILSPYPQKLVVTALGNSASTGPEGITGEVVGFDSQAELEAAPDEAVRGKIVFVSHAMPRTQDGSSYGYFGGPRRQGPTVASRKGAIGIVIRSIGTDYHRNPHTGAQAFAPGVRPIPAGALSIPDAEQVQRILKHANGKPVRMHLTLVSQSGPAESGNVIAEVPGRDPSLPPVLVSGHLDSWDLGTGAVDDASGLAVVTAAAKRIMDAGRPLRTIRVVWFGAEEIGLLGGLEYMRRYRAQPHHVIGESDTGAGRIWRVNSKLGKAREQEALTLQAALAPLGIVPGSLESAEGSDIGPMLASGVPGVGLTQDATNYFDLHHSPDDTLDKIDLSDLQQNVAAWTAMLGVMAGPIVAEPKRPKRR